MENGTVLKILLIQILEIKRTTLKTLKLKKRTTHASEFAKTLKHAAQKKVNKDKRIQNKITIK